MSMKINYNISAIIANNSLKINDNKLTTSLGRLSSGYKINSARDDAAGLAISRRMNAQIKGLEAAEQDAKDGVSVVEIADGALAEVQDILQRMNELAVKSANGTMMDEDRAYIQQEIQSLAEEVDRIGNTTEFNSQKLFTGEFDLKGYSSDVAIKVESYSEVVTTGKYTFDLTNLQFDVDELGFSTLTSYNGDVALKTDFTRPDKETEEFLVSGDRYHLKFTGDDGDEIILDIANLNMTETTDADGNVTSYSYAGGGNVELEITGYGAMTFQIGANESQTVDIRFEKLSMETLGFKNQDSDPLKKMALDLSTEKGALKGIDMISKAMSKVNAMRSKLGAYQNRLEHTESNLSVNQENMTAAYSRIMDTDMSEEMTNYSNLQVVSQAATAILAQANERPSQMLQLLQ